MKAWAAFLLGLVAGTVLGFSLRASRRAEAVLARPAVSAPGTESVPTGDRGATPQEDRQEDAKTEQPGEETPPAPPGPDIGTGQEALVFFNAADEDVRRKSRVYLRKRLLMGSPQERAELDRLLAAQMGAMSLEERVQAFKDLLGSQEWLDFSTRPRLGNGLLGALGETLRELPECTSDHDDLFHFLKWQMMEERDVFGPALWSVLSSPLSEERARFEGHVPEPRPAWLGALLVEQSERLEQEKHHDYEHLFALGGPEAGEADLRTLMGLAGTHPESSARFAALFALSTAAPAQAVDDFIVQVARDPVRSRGDRIAGYLALRHRRKEDLLPRSVRAEILRLWEESGAADFSKMWKSE